ncbi:hypothetical protein L2U69_12600 [Zavarzinia compransoris]|uniref:hypothetical protein n=1 Tax=Zavarzinia marina TaxID=2911065 RepID=UPI001F2E8891|nr:hypothetical protein [Zavarzinia marina]MCF4166486.1 hypothetical protein [Zavarzinia marina]
MRGLAPPAPRPGAIGGVEPVAPRPMASAAPRQGMDWGLGLITIAFLVGAAAIVAVGQWTKRPPESLAAGESRIITARPDTTIPDNGAAAPAGTAASGGMPSAGGAALPGTPYSMDQSTEGGTIDQRPQAHTAPEPAGAAKPRLRSTAPGFLQAPPGMKPVK